MSDWWLASFKDGEVVDLRQIDGEGNKVVFRATGRVEANRIASQKAQADKRNDPRRRAAKEVCRGKADFPTQSDADARAREITARAGKGFRSYRCLECSRWHLTTKGER